MNRQTTLPEEYTILICPECRRQSTFGAMDAVHGMEARCYKHGWEEVEDEHGVWTRPKPGPELIAIDVVPKEQLTAAERRASEDRAKREEAEDERNRAEGDSSVLIDGLVQLLSRFRL